MEVDSSVEVVSIALIAVVDRGRAGAVLAPLVGHEFALLEGRPVGVEVLVELGVAVHVVVDLAVAVGALAAGRIPAGVVGPEPVEGDAAVELRGAGGEDAAPVAAEGALPGLGENHVGPLVLGLVFAVGVHVAVVAGVGLLAKGLDDGSSNQKDSRSLHLKKKSTCRGKKISLPSSAGNW